MRRASYRQLTSRGLLPLLCLALVGCAGRPIATDITDKSGLSFYPTQDPALVFAATKKILLEDGFTLTEESPEELFIAAHLAPGKFSKRILSSAFWDTETVRKDRFEVTVQVLKRPTDTGVRFSVQSVRARSFGSEWGHEMDDVRIHRTFTYLLKILLREARPETAGKNSASVNVRNPSGTVPRKTGKN